MKVSWNEGANKVVCGIWPALYLARTYGCRWRLIKGVLHFDSMTTSRKNTDDGIHSYSSYGQAFTNIIPEDKYNELGRQI